MDTKTLVVGQVDVAVLLHPNKKTRDCFSCSSY